MLKTLSVDYEAASAGELAEALARGEVGAVELFDAAVHAIEAADGPINAVVVRDFERALDAAKEADEALGRDEPTPLLGVPMTIKESHNMVGTPTTWGLAPHKGWTPADDSTGVARLRAAGAIILGKTNVPPNLGDWQAANPIYGRTNNPHDLTRSPGGSSGGGAAALAAGMVPVEFGSDIGGSIRVPAHMCGVFGHKPTFGLVPITGFVPPMVEPDSDPWPFGVIGPLARTASDLQRVLDVLAGPEGDEATAYRLELPPARAERLRDFRVLVLTQHPNCATDAEVGGAVEALGEQLAELGASVDREHPFLPDFAAGQQTYLAMLSALMSRGPGGTTEMSAHDWMGGLDAIALHRRAWAELFHDVDVVLAPPFGCAAFPHAEETDWSKRSLVINGETTPYGAQIAWPSIAAFAGLPATCAPISRTASGLPIGAQIIGPRFEDRTTIAFAGLLERELGLKAIRPAPATR